MIQADSREGFPETTPYAVGLTAGEVWEFLFGKSRKSEVAPESPVDPDDLVI